LCGISSAILKSVKVDISLNTIQEIEQAIGSLTPGELEELYLWLDEHYPNPIDGRISSDLANGSLDAAIHRELDDEKDGRVQPL